MMQAKKNNLKKKKLAVIAQKKKAAVAKKVEKKKGNAAKKGAKAPKTKALKQKGKKVEKKISKEAKKRDAKDKRTNRDLAKLKSQIGVIKKTEKMKENMAPFEKMALEAKANAGKSAPQSGGSGSAGPKVIMVSPPPMGGSAPSPAMFGG